MGADVRTGTRRWFLGGLALVALAGGCAALAGVDETYRLYPEACKPGETRPCYSGPAGTEGVSVCKGGAETCTPDGTGFGACQGKGLPSLEVCTTKEDENCDGRDGCSGACAWAEGLGSAVEVAVIKAATDDAGNILLTGTFGGTLAIGDIQLNSAESADVFLVKLDATGKVLWGKRFGGVGYQSGNGVAVDSEGNVLLTGHFEKSIDFGCGSITANVGEIASHMFTVKLDPAGVCLWSRGFGGALSQTGSMIRVDASNDILLLGSAHKEIDYGGGLLASVVPQNASIAKLDSTGKHIWSKNLGNATSMNVKDIAVDGSGAIVMMGDFFGSIDLGGGPMTASGNFDVLVTKHSASGEHIWSQIFGDSGYQYGTGVAIDGADNVLLTGSFASGIDFGGGLLQSAGEADAFFAKLDESGNHVFSNAFGGANGQAGSSVRADSTGNVVIRGSYSNEIDLGGGPIVPEGAGDSFLGKLDGAGKHLWSRRFGTGNDQLFDMVIDRVGNVVLVGRFTGKVEFNGCTVTANSGGLELFVVKLAP